MATPASFRVSTMNRPLRQTLLSVVIILAAGLGRQALADEFQSHASILAAARAELGERAGDAQNGRVEVSTGRLDKRLRLQPCGEALEAFMPNGARLHGNTSVGVRCDGPTSWRVYVPARVKVFGEVMVAAEPLVRGTQVQPDQLKRIDREISGLPYGYYNEADKLAGMVVKRAVPAGSVITPNMLTAPQLIERGDRVTLIASTGPIEVRMRGEAMSDGAKGERVRVKTLNTRREIEGWVVSRGVVKVTL